MELYVEQHIPYSKCKKDRAMKIASKTPCMLPRALSFYSGHHRTTNPFFCSGWVPSLEVYFFPNEVSHFICYYPFFSVQFFILELLLKVLTQPRYQNGCQMRCYLVLASEQAANSLSNNIQDISYQVMISLTSLSDVGHRFRVV